MINTKWDTNRAYYGRYVNGYYKVAMETDTQKMCTMCIYMHDCFIHVLCYYRLPLPMWPVVHVQLAVWWPSPKERQRILKMLSSKISSMLPLEPSLQVYFTVLSLSLSLSLFIHLFILPQSTLTVAIAPMVTSAKGAIAQSGNAAAQEQFGAKADNVRIVLLVSFKDIISCC